MGCGDVILPHPPLPSSSLFLPASLRENKVLLTALTRSLRGSPQAFITWPAILIRFVMALYRHSSSAGYFCVSLFVDFLFSLFIHWGRRREGREGREGRGWLLIATPLTRRRRRRRRCEGNAGRCFPTDAVAPGRKKTIGRRRRRWWVGWWGRGERQGSGYVIFHPRFWPMSLAVSLFSGPFFSRHWRGGWLSTPSIGSLMNYVSFFDFLLRKAPHSSRWVKLSMVAVETGAGRRRCQMSPLQPHCHFRQEFSISLLLLFFGFFLFSPSIH